MKKLTILSLILTVVLTPTIGFAASPWTSETSYWAKATGKLDLGMKNLLGGWTAFFTEPVNYHQEGKNPVLGFGMGLVKTVAYTVGGALHTVTFPVTALDIPLPDDGVDL